MIIEKEWDHVGGVIIAQHHHVLFHLLFAILLLSSSRSSIRPSMIEPVKLAIGCHCFGVPSVYIGNFSALFSLRFDHPSHRSYATLHSISTMHLWLKHSTVAFRCCLCWGISLAPFRALRFFFENMQLLFFPTLLWAFLYIFISLGCTDLCWQSRS